MKKLLSFLFLSAAWIAEGQPTTRIKYSQMENPATSSVNLGTQNFNAGSSTVTALRVNGALTTTGAITTPTVFGTGNLSVISSTAGTGTISVGGSSCTTVINCTNFVSNSPTNTFTGTIKAGATTFSGTGTSTVATPVSSGTLANLADVLMYIQFASNTSGNPADGDVRYSGIQMPNFTYLPTSTAAIGYYIGDNIEIVGYDITTWNNGVPGTSESVTVNLVSGSASTVVALNSAVNTTNQAQFQGTVTPTSVPAGTRILVQYVFPTYVTNPTSVWFITVIRARRKQ